MLAPIARLLEISTDKLLSYKEDLTEQEIKGIVGKIIEKIQTEPYDKVFEYCRTYIREYPTSYCFILNIAHILNSYRMVLNVEHPETYDKEIKELYSRLLNSKDIEIQRSGAEALFYFFIQKDEYREAEKYLQYIPKQGCDRRRLEALLNEKQGNIERSYEIYEQMLLTGYSDISWAFNGIYILSMKENHIENAEKIIEKQKMLARLMEMGIYMEVSLGLDLAIYQKDKERALEILEKMIGSLNSMDAYKQSFLYSHINRSNNAMENIAFMLKKGFEEDNSIDFLKDDIRYKKLMKQLERQK